MLKECCWAAFDTIPFRKMTGTMVIEFIDAMKFWIYVFFIFFRLVNTFKSARRMTTPRRSAQSQALLCDQLVIFKVHSTFSVFEMKSEVAEKIELKSPSLPIS